MGRGSEVNDQSESSEQFFSAYQREAKPCVCVFTNMIVLIMKCLPLRLTSCNLQIETKKSENEMIIRKNAVI